MNSDPSANAPTVTSDSRPLADIGPAGRRATIAAAGAPFTDPRTAPALAFVAGAGIMIIELVAARLAAQLLGASLYTWSSAIGVVLAGLALGSWLGGILADGPHRRGKLSGVLLVASIASLALPSIHQSVGEIESLWRLAARERAPLHILLVFLPATMTLAMVGPLAARAALDFEVGRGRAVGAVAAWGTTGSIVGVLLAGFVLIPMLGAARAIVVVSVAAALSGVLLMRDWVVAQLVSGVAVLAGAIAVLPGSTFVTLSAALALRPAPTSMTLAIDESAYSLIRIERDPQRQANQLVLDQLVHSVGRPDDPRFLYYDYERIYAALTDRLRPAGKPPRGLAIGGGGYTFPRYFLERYAGGTMQVAEIDPGVTQAAADYFGLNRSEPRLAIADMDGRGYVRNLARRLRGKSAGGSDSADVQPFDFVYGDALSDYAIPPQLTTVEYYRLLADVMSPDGVYLLNLIDGYHSGRFLGATLQTLKDVFPHVLVYATQPGDPGTVERETFVLAAARRPLEGTPLEYQDSDGRVLRYQPLTGPQLAPVLERAGTIVLCDDYCPVQNLLADVALEASRSLREFRERAVDAYNGGDFAEAARLARIACERRADVSTRALLGSALAQSGRAAEAWAEFQSVLVDAPNDPDVLRQAGVVLIAGRRFEEAVELLRRGLSAAPQSSMMRAALGEALLGAGNFKQAAEQLEAAARANPSHAPGWRLLGTALARRNESDRAVAALSMALSLDPNDARAAFELGLIKIDRKSYDEAAGLFDAAARADTGDADALFNLGLALAGAGRRAAAADQYRRSIALDPNRADARLNYADLLAELGKPDEAQRHYEAVIQLDPLSAEAYISLARLRLQQFDPVEGVRTLEAGLAALPDHDRLRRALAQTLSMYRDPRIRDGARAAKLAEQIAAASQPAAPDVLFLLAASYAQAGRFADAVTTAEQGAAAAKDAGDAALVASFERCLTRYRAGKAFPAAGEPADAASQPSSPTR